MKTNWLWDSRLNETQVRQILSNGKDARFMIYAEKLLSRVSDPGIVFDLMDKMLFCQSWPRIKVRMRRDRWLKTGITFWQTMYEGLREQFKESGEKIRTHNREKIPSIRLEVAMQIRKLRKKLGCTQQDLAGRLGVIQQYVSRVETGRENFSVDALTRIARAFGKDLLIKLK